MPLHRRTRGSGLGTSGSVPLHPDGIGFRYPRPERGINVARVGQTKVMHVVARGDGFHPREARVLVNRREDEMTTKPRLPNHDRHERHPSVAGDSSPLRQDGDGTTGLDHGADSPEERLDRARFPGKVPRQRLARAAEVRPTTIGESPAAPGATPKRPQTPTLAAPHDRTPLPAPDGRRRRGARRAEGDERVRCTPGVRRDGVIGRAARSLRT